MVSVVDNFINAFFFKLNYLLKSPLILNIVLILSA